MAKITNNESLTPNKVRLKMRSVTPNKIRQEMESVTHNKIRREYVVVYFKVNINKNYSLGSVQHQIRFKIYFEKRTHTSNMLILKTNNQ